MASAGSPRRLTLVYARWCPHCVPLSTDRAPRLAERLHAELRLLDIDDPAQELEADRLVEAAGDWSPDYLIPQLFLEWEDGRLEHLLTGTPGAIEATRRSWDALLAQA